MAFRRKWKPNASQRRAFAERMQDPEEKAAYEARKEARAEKRRAGSNFDYATAGGQYVPTEYQYSQAMFFLGHKELDDQQKDACNQVVYGFTCQEKIHHDYIHVVNELTRADAAA